MQAKKKRMVLYNNSLWLKVHIDNFNEEIEELKKKLQDEQLMNKELQIQLNDQTNLIQRIQAELKSEKDQKSLLEETGRALKGIISSILS